MFLVIGLFERVGAPDALAERLRAAGVVDPWVVRARSLSALTADVPIFGGLRSLASGADADRLVVLSLLGTDSAEDARQLLRKAEEAARAADLAARWWAVPLLSSSPG